MLLYTSTKRGRFAIFWVVVAIAGPIATMLEGGGSIEAALAGAVGALVIAALLLLKDFRYSRASTDALWGKWADCHDTEPQRLRADRARIGELAVKRVDQRARVALFVGGQGKNYRTTLLSCTCPDFAKRGIPCKHIYRLAINLGIQDLPEPIPEYEYEQ